MLEERILFKDSEMSKWVIKITDNRRRGNLFQKKKKHIKYEI